VAKAAGAFLRFAFGLLILLALGYNTWQVHALRAEVEALKRQRATSVKADRVASRPPTKTAAAGTPLDRARRHTERAREFLRRGKYADAQREIRAATEALREASRDAQDTRNDALREARGALRTLSQEVERLWRRSGGKESEKPR
jgi:hypothetical protein